MVNKEHRHLNPQEVIALRGIRLPAAALKQLRNAGIYCQPAISIECRQAKPRYVLRGVESGGSAGNIGAYCGFVDLNGSPLPWLQQVESIGVNGQHAVVVAQAMIRMQMFRAGNLCELLISRHILESVPDRERPVLDNRILFHERNGILDPELQALPRFLSRAGELETIPLEFHEATMVLCKSIECCGCQHTHLLRDPVAAAEAAALEVTTVANRDEDSAGKTDALPKT